jgi:hypothetical protein
MRITFICGCLQEGQDGVGDYIYRLCTELVRNNHSVTAMSLHESSLSHALASQYSTNNVLFPILRIPSSYSTNQKTELINEWLTTHQPDWLSLHYVPFSFQAKGIHLTLSSFLKKLSGHHQWHLMCHELWVGMSENSPWLLKGWGWLQKRLIKGLISTLTPAVIHTQSRLYQAQLARLGIRAQRLPLFPTIPLLSVKRRTRSSKSISFLVFGTIHPGAPIEAFAQECRAYSDQYRLAISMTFMGRCGTEQDRWANAFRVRALPVHELGALPAEAVSDQLQIATVGITSTVFPLTDKSSAVAAFAAHGLPILCVAEAWQPRPSAMRSVIIDSPGIRQYHPGNLDWCLSNLGELPVSHSVETIADALVAELYSASSHSLSTSAP